MSSFDSAAGAGDNRISRSLASPVSTSDDPFGANGGDWKHQPPTMNGSSSSSSGALIPEHLVPSQFHQLWESFNSRGTVSLSNATKLLHAGQIKSSEIDKILSLTADDKPSLNRSDFFLALALLASAQNGDALSISSVRDSVSNGFVPSPHILPPSSLGRSTSAPPVPKPSSGSDLSDPWGVGRGGASTSFPPVAPSNTSTRSYSNNDHNNVDDLTPYGGDFANGSAIYGLEQWALPRQEKVEVSQKQELGGWILKHTVWVVRNERSGLFVERRYSDFVWLLDCLTKRYPFRLLPSLPPKHLAVHLPMTSGYVGADDNFLDRRRRGLQRFLSYLANHHIIKRDSILNTFLHEQTELSVWRKHNALSLEEEALTRGLTPVEEQSIPEDLDSKLSAVRSRINSLVEHWTRIAQGFDRIVRRREAQAGDWARLSVGLESVLETERNGWRPREVESTEADEEVVAVHAGKAAETLEYSAGLTTNETLESVKRHRELYAYFRDLLARQIALSPDAVDKLKKRTESNLRKLEQVRVEQKPEWQQEAGRLATVIEEDQKNVDLLLKRRVFIRFCMYQELIFLFRCMSLFSLAVRSFAKEERRFVERLVENWTSLEETLINSSSSR